MTEKHKKKINWAAMILLILGLSTIIFLCI